MKLKKYFKIALFSFIILVLLGFFAFYFKSPEIRNCFLISLSNNFSERENNLYISKDTPKVLQDSIISLIKLADQRVCRFWNTDKRAGSPIFIFCYSNDELMNFSKSNAILTYRTPINDYVVFGKDRINLDMISHELLHTELTAKAGYFKMINKIPVWFDEGVAMQVDYRPEFSEEKYLQVKDSLGYTIELAKISAPNQFYKDNHYYHFLQSRHEVDSWLKIAKLNGLYQLVNRIKNGEDFNFVYNELKNKTISN